LNNSIWLTVVPSIFGVKFVDYALGNRGYYMNRYSAAEISAIVAKLPVAGFEILDRTNRPYFAGAHFEYRWEGQPEPKVTRLSNG
jgi:hypothetical protein